MAPKKSVKKEVHYYSKCLKDKLKNMLSVPATVIAAPSGYGKSTAVHDFLQAELTQGTPVYWFTATDEMAAEGFRRLCREIDKIDSNVGERLLKIELPNAGNVGEACDSVRSINCGKETYLVIDNFQFLQPGMLPPFLTAIIEHGGEGLHIIIVTQMVKKNMLTAIAGRGVLYVTASDLRLASEDIRNYYALAGVNITKEEARHVESYTEGWMIAVYLQLCAIRETGSISEAAGILSIMEALVWNPMTEAQQMFLLRVSPFEVITVHQACILNGWDTLPEYAQEALASPFIRYEPRDQQYELHSILSELLARKRDELGAAFSRDCLRMAGDFCRQDGKIGNAMYFYSQIKDYERMLSLDFSSLILENIGETPFYQLALDIANHCPLDIKRHCILSMLRTAWALRMDEMKTEFSVLMEELRIMLEEESQEENTILKGEWMLLSSFAVYPKLDEMTEILRQAVPLFNGRCSQVILPTAPWGFGNFSIINEFHMNLGQADQEADAFEEYIRLYSGLTNGSGCGADVAFRMELAYYRGDLREAEILAYKAVFLAESKQQSIVQLSATKMLGEVALYKADTTDWEHAISSMERAVSYPSQNTYIVRAALDTVRGMLLTELQNHLSIPEWLQNTEFMQWLHITPMINNALFVYFAFLMHQGEFPRIIGTLEAIPPEVRLCTPLSDMFYYMLMAVGYMQLGNRSQAAVFIEKAAERTLPDGLVSPLAAYSFQFDGIMDEIVESKYPELFAKYKEVKNQFITGWTSVHEAISPSKLPADLTAREYEVAILASQGLRNNEIAGKLFVSESTVRAHLRTIFQKFEIDRRAKLAEKLKS